MNWLLARMGKRTWGIVQIEGQVNVVAGQSIKANTVLSGRVVYGPIGDYDKVANKLLEFVSGVKPLTATERAVEKAGTQAQEPAQPKLMPTRPRIA